MASSSDGTSIEPTQFMTLLEQNDNNGNTLLHALAKTDHFEAIMAMVKEHCTADQCTAVLSKQNNTGNTPLHLCTIPYSNILHDAMTNETMKTLLTIQNHLGNTPLHDKAKSGELTQTLTDLKTLDNSNKLIDTDYLTCLTQQNKNQTPSTSH